MIIDPEITEKFVSEELKGWRIKKNKDVIMEVVEPEIHEVSFFNIELKPIVKKDVELYITQEEKKKRLKDLIHLNLHDAAIIWKYKEDLPLSWKQKKEKEPTIYICFEDTDVEYKKGKVKKGAKILFYHSVGKWWIDFLEIGSTIHSGLVWATYKTQPQPFLCQTQGISVSA